MWDFLKSYEIENDRIPSSSTEALKTLEAKSNTSRKECLCSFYDSKMPKNVNIIVVIAIIAGTFD